MRILIPNGSSPKNLGDQAMLESLINFIRNKYPRADITVHSFDTLEMTKHLDSTISVRPSITSWISYPDERFSVRLIKLIQAICSMVFYKINFLFPQNLISILNDYRASDYICFVGNGAYRSRSGIKQSVYLFLQLIPFIYIKRFSKKSVVFPMSFGPFAHRWQEKFSRWVISFSSIVYVREEISQKLFNNTQSKKAVLLPDLAFLINGGEKKLNDSDNKITIGITVRNWLKNEKDQRLFISQLSEALLLISNEFECVFQPIIQVHAPEYDDHDAKITIDLINSLKGHVAIADVAYPTSVKDALQVYKSCDFLIGMRMHSNILSAVSGTPFLAISYEHKFEGICSLIGMNEYVISVHNFTTNRLLEKFRKLTENKEKISSRLHANIMKLRDEYKSVQLA